MKHSGKNRSKRRADTLETTQQCTAGKWERICPDTFKLHKWSCCVVASASYWSLFSDNSQTGGFDLHLQAPQTDLIFGVGCMSCDPKPMFKPQMWLKKITPTLTPKKERTKNQKQNVYQPTENNHVIYICSGKMKMLLLQFSLNIRGICINQK